MSKRQDEQEMGQARDNVNNNQLNKDKLSKIG
jgi:hypothetical protein